MNGKEKDTAKSVLCHHFFTQPRCKHAIRRYDVGSARAAFRSGIVIAKWVGIFVMARPRCSGSCEPVLR